LIEPGTQDITTQVMIDQLMSTVPYLSVTRQSEWLHIWGITELVDDGMKYWEQHKSFPDIHALKMGSRANEAPGLTAGDGLGSFLVLEIIKEE
jgi:hypothetical protein